MKVCIRAFDSIQKDINISRDDAPDIPSLRKLLKRNNYFPILSSLRITNNEDKDIEEKQNLSDVDNIIVQQIPSAVSLEISLENILQEFNNIFDQTVPVNSVKIEISSEKLSGFLLENLFFIDLLDSMYIEYKGQRHYIADRYYSLIYEIFYEDISPPKYSHSFVCPFPILIKYESDTSLACFNNNILCYENIIEKIECIFPNYRSTPTNTLYVIKKDQTKSILSKNENVDLNLVQSFHLSANSNSNSESSFSRQSSGKIPETDFNFSDFSVENEVLDEVDYDNPPPAAAKLFPPKSLTEQVTDFLGKQVDPSTVLIIEAAISKYILFQRDDIVNLVINRFFESDSPASSGDIQNYAKQELLELFVQALKREPTDRAVRGALKVTLQYSSIEKGLTYLFSARPGRSSDAPRNVQKNAVPGTLINILTEQRKIDGQNWRPITESEIDRIIASYSLVITPEERKQAIDEFCRKSTNEKEVMINTLVEMGDTWENAIARLDVFDGNMEQAVESLLIELQRNAS